MYQPITTLRAYEAIVSQIEQMIADKQIQVGEQLPGERDLAEKFGVSRVVIREAIRTLEARGLIDVRHGSGTYVKGMPGDTLTRSLTLLLELKETSLLDLYVVRQALEIVAAPRAAQYATPQQINSLRQCLARMEETIHKGFHDAKHFEEFTQRDIELHSLVGEASHNLPLSTLLNAILPLIMRGRLEIINRTGGFEKFIARSRPEIILDEHTNIVNAIANHDPAAAEHFIYKHLQRSMATYRDLAT
ncbi:MAG TPA: FadR/GntR family transcriptional regulator [Anaerolineae bacterium]|nr:FadR/GntR family transcriptional regulator [Anaerolineae bacterium]